MARPIAAITGASSGIGAVFARKLAPDYDLILIARRRDRMEQLAEELNRLTGSQVEVIAADLSSLHDTSLVAERLSAELRLMLLINNAGFGSRGRFWEASLESQEQMHQVHVMATMRLSHAVLPGMVARDRGAIINVSSVAAFARSPGAASYNATKSWIAVFTEALHLELKVSSSRVRVQALCPGYTYSEFHDTLGLDRASMAGPGLWMKAERVVSESLRALDEEKLFVIPGWQYQLLCAVIPKLPVGLRLFIEERASRSRRRQFLAETRGD